MVDKSHNQLSIARQCLILGLSRSTYYYQPRGESPYNLELMRVIDREYLQFPFFGTRQMRRHLRNMGYEVGRRRVKRLMRKMGIRAVYRKPRTSQPEMSHKVYPYLLRGLAIDRPNQVWCADITYIPVHQGFMYLPSYAYLSNGKKHDVAVARNFPLAPGSIVTMDRGYNDYSLTRKGVFFVTRMKENADYITEETRGVPQGRNVLSDERIRFAGYNAIEDCPHILRRIVVWDAVNQKEIVLLTNHLEFGASTISAIYKDRWQIELFFKAIKQNLKIKTFVGTSENALYIQIWTALIAMLLIKFLQLKSKFGWSLSNLVAFLRWSLFTNRGLWEWLDKPFDVLPKAVSPTYQQLALF